MKTIYRRPVQSLIPPYKENGALQLVAATGVTFIMFHFVRIAMLLMEMEKDFVFNAMYPNIGLSDKATFLNKFWTIFTYGLAHHGFWDWITNVIWMYCFASVLQNLAGYKQVIPLFVYALVVGGGFYIGSEFLAPNIFDKPHVYFLGAQAGVISLGFAAFVLMPSYRLHITPGFSIPLTLVLGIYVLLDIIVYVPGQMNVLMLCLGGAATGSVFALLLRNGYKPGEWIYKAMDKLEYLASPDEEALADKRSRKRMEVLRTMYEPKKGVSQNRIDEILDKINEHGYHSLSKEEKETLIRAGKE